MQQLTERQEAVFEWVVGFVQQHGLPPTVREIGRAFGITSAGAFGHLKALETKGLLKRGPLGARSLEILTGGTEAGEGLRVPVVGRIAAGTPILATENLEGHVTVDASLASADGAACFALRVQGDSMIDAGILDGDLAIIRMQSHAEDGQVVAALLDDEATLKRLRKRKGRISLEPANKRMKPIFPTELAIQGVMVGLVRQTIAS